MGTGPQSKREEHAELLKKAERLGIRIDAKLSPIEIRTRVEQGETDEAFSDACPAKHVYKTSTIGKARAACVGAGIKISDLSRTQGEASALEARFGALYDHDNRHGEWAPAENGPLTLNRVP